MHRGELLFADTGAYFHRGGFSTTLPRTYAGWVYYDATIIRSKPRYNLTSAARMKFPSRVLWERWEWDRQDLSDATPIPMREILKEN